MQKGGLMNEKESRSSISSLNRRINALLVSENRHISLKNNSFKHSFIKKTVKGNSDEVKLAGINDEKIYLNN